MKLDHKFLVIVARQIVKLSHMFWIYLYRIIAFNTNFLPFLKLRHDVSALQREYSSLSISRTLNLVGTDILFSTTINAFFTVSSPNFYMTSARISIYRFPCYTSSVHYSVPNSCISRLLSAIWKVICALHCVEAHT